MGSKCESIRGHRFHVADHTPEVVMAGAFLVSRPVNDFCLFYIDWPHKLDCVANWYSDLSAAFLVMDCCSVVSCVSSLFDCPS